MEFGHGIPCMEQGTMKGSQLEKRDEETNITPKIPTKRPSFFLWEEREGKRARGPSTGRSCVSSAVDGRAT